ncbi:DUF3050 domain-containing protein [Sulfurimonas marina]|uniref:DUF3050 domain-containing protein n=1 Tax=Sulfurimonas marina TaxID=2590551 RepID=A0A7M1AWZ7_9BACT|nr:DUF3050 domain-containing protein [Sulfurimonas marina]QOP41108.1 DUF3050 domain-containing protein [Sulfurimonas marina]
MSTFPLEEIAEYREKLAQHPVYAAVKSMDDLNVFMAHHVYSVWDFMSLAKYLQNCFAPSQTPWMPRANTDVQRFINDIILEEETDLGLPLADGTPTYSSHFELYTQAMEEVKAGSSQNVYSFLKSVQYSSVDEAFNTQIAPFASQEFMKTTFGFIKSDKPHLIAAAFALGREHIIPKMFRALLEKMAIKQEDIQVFHYYLERHIELDSDHHGPMSLKMLEILCEDNPEKIEEAKQAAIEAIEARIKFWDGVLEAIEQERAFNSYSRKSITAY